jgi:hypothetical protein
MESISLKLRLWITNENRLIHRVESSEVVSANLSAEMMGGIPGTLSQQTTIRSTLSNFNEPVEIEAPELAE